MSTTTSERLSQTAAQRLFLSLTTAAVRQIDVAASTRASARDRTRALSRLQRAISALEDPKKIAA